MIFAYVSVNSFMRSASNPEEVTRLVEMAPISGSEPAVPLPAAPVEVLARLLLAAYKYFTEDAGLDPVPRPGRGSRSAPSGAEGPTEPSRRRSAGSSLDANVR
jgi:hypothetical protein